jgi:MerR family transcriptional regulator/heat shock protein HspR
MDDNSLIPAIDFCTSHRVEIELVHTLNKQGLIEVITYKKLLFIPENQIKKLERILVFHRELDINLEGVETILSLLQRMESMQEHILELENKLQRFL